MNRVIRESVGERFDPETGMWIAPSLPPAAGDTGGAGEPPATVTAKRGRKAAPPESAGDTAGGGAS